VASRRKEQPAHQKLLARQKAAAERVRREVLGADGSLRHPYFRDLRRQLKAYDGPIELAELYDACAGAQIVYVGDFHALPSCQRFAADLLSNLAGRLDRVALGVEFVYTRQQRFLDRRQSGLIDDVTFLRRIHYREEWGYAWEGFAALLDAARDRSVPVYALDAPPRGGFDGLARRDEHAARRITSIITSGECSHLVVLFGESHLSRGHIPKRVRSQLARMGEEREQISVFQDPDPIYWEIASQGEPLPPAVRLDEQTLAVFHGSPLAKYEAYRQVMERWRGDVPPEEEVDLTPAVHHLIGVLLGWLGIRASRHRLRHRAGWTEDLSDAFPEVYSGPEAAELLEPILEEQGRTAAEIAEARSLLAQRGALYESRSNAIFLLRYLPARAAAEGARFLRAALSGRLFELPEEGWDDPVSRAYGAAYNEGLAFLGARLVDPASDFLSGEERRALSASAGAREEPVSGEVAERVRWLSAHRRIETSRGARIPPSVLQLLRRSRRVRRNLGRDLGNRLGQLLYDRVRSGELDARGLRALFRRSISPDRAQKVVLQILRGAAKSKSKKRGRA
jgi:hypothetical protein